METLVVGTCEHRHPETRHEGQDSGSVSPRRRVSQIGACSLPTRHGQFRLEVFQVEDLAGEFICIRAGSHPSTSMATPVLVRLHSECLTGDALGSLRCDCGEQLQASLEMIAAHNGLVLYLRQEGRGIGLFNKVRAYDLQDEGLDTVEANERLGFAADLREYSSAADVLKSMGISHVRLLTNNRLKINALQAEGIHVVERVPLVIPPNGVNTRYLQTKSSKMGHLLNGNSTNRAKADPC